MNIDELTLGQIKQIKALIGNDVVKSCATEQLGKHIVVLQRGWVIVGSLEKNGDNFRVPDARVIRRWGTTGGLAHLANHGPQPETVLEEPADSMFHELTVVQVIKCAPQKW